MKIVLTEDELKALMYEATKTWNLTVSEKTEVTMEVGIKMYIDRLINTFKDAKSK